jgi:hypothetical protein
LMIVLALQCRQRLSARAFPATGSFLSACQNSLKMAVGLTSAKLEAFATWLTVSRSTVCYHNGLPLD